MEKTIFVSLVLSCIGFPARNYGGQHAGFDENGFDCSGFVNFLLKKARYPGYIPRHASEFFDSFGILIHEQFRDAGDLVFFSNRGGTYPDHVGILVSQEEYVHSPGRNGKVVCADRFKPEIIKPRRDTKQIYFSNPIGVKRIAIGNGRYKLPFLV
jgi:cell wall-associated NlpC family hydrolase